MTSIHGISAKLRYVGSLEQQNEGATEGLWSASCRVKVA